MVPTLDHRGTLDSLYHALLYTLVRLHQDARLVPFVPPFEEARVVWWDIFKKERDLEDERIEADASVTYADANLDVTSDAIAATILIETKGNRRSDLFMRYFGTQQPNRFRRSVLGPQLTEMRTWPPSLKESPNPALKAYGEGLVTQIQAADDALTLVSVAEQKMDDFRTMGERRQLFDKVNGLRKRLYGDVSQMVHDHPEWRLNQDYVNALFEHEVRREVSDAELTKKIDATGAELKKLTDLREERVKEAKAAEAARIEAENKAKLAAIASAEQAAAQANAKLASLLSQLGTSTAAPSGSPTAPQSGATTTTPQNGATTTPQNGATTTIPQNGALGGA